MPAGRRSARRPRSSCCTSISGHAAEVLAAEAQRVGAELLVMGAYGHSPLRSLIVGSTTTAVVRGVDRAVLLFR